MDYTKTLACLLAIYVQQAVPSKKPHTSSNIPRRENDRVDEAVPAYEAVLDYIHDEATDYHGRSLEDVLISAPMLTEILDMSSATARRHLQYFREQGLLVEHGDDARRTYYEFNPDYTGLGDENIRSESTIIDNAKQMLNLAVEE